MYSMVKSSILSYNFKTGLHVAPSIVFIW